MKNFSSFYAIAALLGAGMAIWGTFMLSFGAGLIVSGVLTMIIFGIGAVVTT